MKITTVGIDLATQVFQVHGVDERGKALLKKQLIRDQVLPFFANFQCCFCGTQIKADLKIILLECVRL
jgi:transposase